MTRNLCNQNQCPALETKVKKKQLKLQIVITRREHIMVNRMSSSSPKGGHSATLTNLNNMILSFRHI